MKRHDIQNKNCPRFLLHGDVEACAYNWSGIISKHCNKTGSFLLRRHNFPLNWRHRGQEDPADAHIHRKPFRKKEKKKGKKKTPNKPNNMRDKHCAQVRDTVLL